jgi:hypothetical protein
MTRQNSQEAPRALLAVSGLLVLGAAVGTMLFLGSRSLWWDELFAVSIASPEVAWDTAIELIRADVHPPLYFLLLRAWLHFLQADGEFAARSLNYVVYVFAAILMLAYVRRRPSVGSVLWFLFAFTSFGFVWYLQEARMYAFAIANAICACVLAMDFEERRAQKLDATYLIVCLVTFVVLPLSHWFSFAFSGGILLGLFSLCLARRWRTEAALYFGLGVVLLVAGGGYILLNLHSTVGQLGSYGKQHVFGGTVSLWGLRTSATGVLLFALSLNPILVMATAVGFSHVIVAPLARSGLTLIVVVTILLTASILGISFVSPMYQARNFAWEVGPLSLLAALGLERVLAWIRVGERATIAVALVVTAVSLGIGLISPRLYPLELDQWREAGNFVATRSRCEHAPLHVSAQWMSGPSPIAERYTRFMYGYYGGDDARYVLVFRGDNIPSHETSPCDIQLWVAQMPYDDALRFAEKVLGPKNHDLETVQFVGHTFFLRRGNALKDLTPDAAQIRTPS